MFRTSIQGFFISVFLAGSISVFAAQESSKTLSKQSQKCDLQFKKLKVCGSIQWRKPPQVVEMITPKDASEMTIELRSLDRQLGDSLKDLEISVKPTMPAMGHGTEPTQVSRLTPGVGRGSVSTDSVTFLVKDIFLSMPGEWRFQVKVKRKNRELDQSSWVYELK